MTISGLGPHGERAAPPERISLLPDDRIAAKSAGWRVAIVLHTLESDWAKQLVAGMVGIFGDCGAAVVDVVDCGFSPERQTAELDRLAADRPDAIISLPVANEQVAAAHARVSAAGIKLILLDNAPTGLLPGKHYTALVSADNFGLGKIAAAGLSPELCSCRVPGRRERADGRRCDERHERKQRQRRTPLLLYLLRLFAHGRSAVFDTLALWALVQAAQK